MGEETLNKKEVRREIMRQFVKFLKEKGVYVKYKENLMHVVSSPTKCTTRMEDYQNYIGFTYGLLIKILQDNGTNERRLFNVPLASEFINFAFCWEDTPQRHEFWERISDEWRRYVYKNLYNKYAHIICEF